MTIPAVEAGPGHTERVTRFAPSPGLDVIVAQRVLAPEVARIARRIERVARARALPARIWITSHDERVRPTHVEADGQTIPENLRFVLSLPGRAGQTELAREPRDESLSAGNFYNCRCAAVSIPGAIARRIHAGPTVVAGTVVRARVTSEFPRIAESEHGTSGDVASRTMGSAADTVAAELRGAARR